MELRDLEYFVAVSEELHFARAAARLHIVPAAVSQRIRDLERELGVVLFERTSRRVALSPAGSTLLPLARTALAAFADVAHAAEATRTGRQGRVQVGFSPGSAHLLDALVRRADAGVEIIAESMWSVQALTALVRGELGLALVRDPLPSHGVESIVVASYRDGFVAVAAPGPLADRETVSLSEFEGRPFLLNERDVAPGVHDATVRFFAEHGVTPIWRHHRLQEQEQQLSLVAAGSASALVHSHRAGIAAPGVVVLPLQEPGPIQRFHLVWRAGDRSPAVDAVRDLAAQVIMHDG